MSALAPRSLSIIQSIAARKATPGSHEDSRAMRLKNLLARACRPCDRLEYPQLRRKVIALWGQFGADVVLIEEAGPGQALL
jgi:hypothetical protein